MIKIKNMSHLRSLFPFRRRKRNFVAYFSSMVETHDDPRVSTNM